MVAMSSLLDVCPDGVWVTEDRAVEVLGFESNEALKQKFTSGSLPHVHVEHGKRVQAPAPYSQHRFFFIQNENSSAGHPSIGLGEWTKICSALESGDVSSIDSETTESIKKYTTRSDMQEAYTGMKDSNAIVSSADLPTTGADDDGYSYGTSGGRVPSKAAADSDVYVRADGKKVRRIKRASSAAASATSLAGFLSGAESQKGESKLAKLSGSRSAAGDGEVYVRADGKKVRRVKKSSASSVSSEDPSKKSLSGFLDRDPGTKKKLGGSASVAGDQIAVSKDNSLTGEVYVRADGKKVRRVRKSAALDENVEIITRPDGTKVRRIKKTKPVEKSASVTGAGLSGFLDQSLSSEPRTKFSGSHSVAGDRHLDGEIYVRPDGKKVRRVRKAKPKEASDSGGSLSGFLGSDTSSKPKGGSATVGGERRVQKGDETEIFVRPDGTKVRRIKRTAAKPAGGSSEKKGLGGFLENSGGSKPRLGGSASVAGDQIAVSKDASLTGEVYIRADGKKVRRVKKSSAAPGDNVEIITRPDGTKVRRIRKGPAKPKPEEKSDDVGLSSFLDARPNTAPKGGAATVGGDRVAQSEVAQSVDDAAARTAANKKTLDGFLGNMDSSPKKLGGSASVAGDQIAVSKASSLTGEVYVRADGKKVRRVKKPAAAQPGDQVEIITRPDGTKVRRIRRAAAKPPSEGTADAGGEPKKSLDGFLSSSSTPAKKMGGSASVSGDMLHSTDAQGEIYVRADGKKVRRIRKSAVAATDDQYEIYVRPDGKKVRRIKRSAITAKNSEAAKQTQKADQGASLAGMLDKDDAAASKPGSAATGAGDNVTGKSSLQTEVPAAVSAPVEPTPKVSSLSPEEEVIASQYRKMSKMGMPDGAIAQKMSVDGAAQNIQDSVLAGEVPATTTAPAPAELTAKVSSLSAEEEEIASQYRKMSKMGMPDGAVAQKMAVDEVAENIQDSVLAGEVPATVAPAEPVAKVSSLSAEEEEIASQYRKMSKMGMPDGAVAQKMAVDEVAQNIQGSVLSGEVPAPTTPAEPVATVSSLCAEEEEIASQYRKMSKMGMPDGAVAQKMAVDEVAQNIQDSVLAGEVPATAVASTPASAEPVAKVSSLSAEEEEIASQYRKMSKMGMPDGAVAQKMAVDEVAQNIQDSVLAGEVPAPATPAEPATKVSSLSAEEEEIASQYRKMSKMGMPDGAVAQKMSVDEVAQNIQDSVLAGEVPATAVASTPANGQAIPEGMALVPKDQATVPDGMVLVPKEQAARTIPEGMVAVPKEQVGEGIPEGYVLVPKDQVKGNPGDDLVLVRSDQVKNEGGGKPTVLVMMQPDEAKNDDKEIEKNKDVDISGANIVSMDDLNQQVEKMKKVAGTDGSRFLLQALPSDRDLEDDFIRKNLLPKAPDAAPAPAPAPAPKPAASSSSIAELLAQMSTMGGDFDAEKMGGLLQKLEDAEKRQKKLEKQLQQAGVAIAEDIDYDICLKKVSTIGKRMNEIGSSDVTHPDKDEQNKLREEYFLLEQEMEKYSSALLLTDEYQAEQDRIAKKWETDNAPGNLEALKKLRRHMPVEVRNMSEAQLTTEPTPNGKYIPKTTAKKFKRTNVLQVIRRDPDDISRMHPSTLENMRVTGLTLTERRGIYEHIRTVGPKWESGKAEKMTERKWTWFNMMKGNFKENLASWTRHVNQYGPPGAHPYATRANPNEGCPFIGKQCPLKADKLIDYDGDYGYTDEGTYEVSEVRKADVDDPGAKAKAEALELMKEKKANERGDVLKKHYKGKLLQVSKANGSCEAMDDIMDKMEYSMEKHIEDIIHLGDDKSKLTDDVKKKELGSFNDTLSDCKLGILDFCGRSGMQLSGKKSADEKPDPRSVVECSLAGEVKEYFEIYSKFMVDRLKFTEIIDSRIKSNVDMLMGLCRELGERNDMTFKNLDKPKMDRSRPLKTQAQMENEIKEKIKSAEPPPEAEEAGGGGRPAMPGPPRGGLMDAIGGRGKGRGGGGRGGLLDAIGGGRGKGRGGGGRGGLLDAIGGKGKGRGGGGGRGGLLDAIGGRGKGGGGGRGGLLDAIGGRGKGGGGGRGGLLDAIGGRGKSDGGGGGGRGGLMAAIAARNGG